jgi:hypothetical protein
MKTVLLSILCVFSLCAWAQEITLIEGDPKAMKGLKSIATRITYDGVIIGADIQETAYVNARKAEWDSEQSGKGEQWVNHWNGSKTSLYGPAFSAQFAKNSGVKVENNATYTMILKTKQIEPGWNGGPMGGKAFIVCDLWIVDTSDESKVIAKFNVGKTKGLDKTGGDFEMGRRIQQAYANAGIKIGAYFKKKLL